jgi:DNA-binding transcriptional LysR family regulator
MNTEQFRTFLIAAEEGTATGTAARLGRSQSSVSRELAALEDALGMHLFRRRPRGLELTAAGQAMLSPAQEIVDAVDAMLKAVSDM